MIQYYKFDITSKDGNHLDYPMDLELIYHIRYEWVVENKGKGAGVVHAHCVAKSNDPISNLESITEIQYESFGLISVIQDKYTVTSETDESPKLTVTLPSAKGKIFFKYIFPDKTTKVIEKTNDGTNQMICDSNDVKKFKKGTVKVSISTDTWHIPYLKRPEITFESE